MLPRRVVRSAVESLRVKIKSILARDRFFILTQGIHTPCVHGPILNVELHRLGDVRGHARHEPNMSTKALLQIDGVASRF